MIRLELPVCIQIHTYKFKNPKIFLAQAFNQDLYIPKDPRLSILFCRFISFTRWPILILSQIIVSRKLIYHSCKNLIILFLVSKNLQFCQCLNAIIIHIPLVIIIIKQLTIISCKNFIMILQGFMFQQLSLYGQQKHKIRYKVSEGHRHKD